MNGMRDMTVVVAVVVVVFVFGLHRDLNHDIE